MIDRRLPVALRLEERNLGRREELPESHRPDRARALQHRVEHRVRPDERARVGMRGLARSGVAAGFQHDHGLQPRGIAQGRDEAGRLAHPFDVEQDRVGMGIGGEILEHLAEVDVDGIAQRDERREPEVMRSGPVGNRRAERAGLGDQREPPLRRAVGQDRGVHLVPRPHEAHAVRPHEAHARTRGDGAQVAVVLLPGPGLVEARRQDHRVADARVAAVADDAGDGAGGGGDDGEVHVLADGGGGAVAAQPAHGVVARVHRVYVARELALGEVGEHLRPDAAGGLRRADDRDRGGVHHALEGAVFHVCSLGRGPIRSPPYPAP
jgi:hypothetical protein